MSRLRLIDRSLTHAATQLYKLGTLPALFAIAGAAAVWMFRHEDRLAILAKNKLPPPERSGMLTGVAISAGVLALVYVAAIVAVWLRHRQWRVAGTIARLNRLLFFVLALPFMAVLKTPAIEATSTKLTLFLIACAAALCTPTLVAVGRELGLEAPEKEVMAPPTWRRYAARLSPYVAALAVLAAWGVYSWFFSDLAITNHHALNTRTTDLGYYDNIFYQSIHGRPLACTFIKTGYHGSAHFDPILVLLSPLYLLHPRAEMLLVLQSVWLGAGAIPVYLLAAHQLRSRAAGVVLAIAYVLFPAMHGANLYEFHSLTLLVTPLLWVLYALETKRVKLYFLLLLVTLLVREDAALVMCFVGGYSVLSRQPTKTRMGWATIVLSIAYFVVVKRFFMTSSDIFMSGPEAYSFAYYYRDLIPPGGSGGFREFITSVVTNPMFVVELAFREPKVVFLATLFLPLLFLPALARPGRVMMLYGLLFVLLATRKPVYSIHFQYTAAIFPIMFMLTPIAIERLGDGRAARLLQLSRRQVHLALLGALLVASALSSWKFGAFVENKTFRGGFTRVTRELTDKHREHYAHVRQLADMIPPGASVTVTNRIGPHVSNRQHVYFYRQKQRTHFVFIDERELKGDRRGWHRRRVKRGELVEIGSYKTIKLYELRRPGGPTTVEPLPEPKRPPAKKRPRPKKPRPRPTSTSTPPPSPELDDQQTGMPERAPGWEPDEGGR